MVVAASCVANKEMTIKIKSCQALRFLKAFY